MNAKNTEWWKSPEFAPFFGSADNKQQTAQPQFNAQAIGGKYGYTGNGPDGVAQPDRRVPGTGSNQTDKHESEFVMDANTTQAIGPDVLAQVMRAAKSGKLDLNKLREAVGMQPKQGFQAGGLAPAIGPSPALKRPQEATPDVTAPPDLNVTPQGLNIPNIKNQVIGGGGGIIPNKPQDLNIPNIQNQVIGGGGGIIPDKPKPVVVPKIKQQTITAPNIIPQFSIIGKDGSVVPPAKNIGTVTPAQNLGTGVDPMSDKKVIQAVQPMVDKSVVQKAFQPAADKNAAKKAINDLPVDVQEELKNNNIPQQDIIDYLMGIMKGDNPYFKMLQDLLSQKIGGAGAAATAAMKQEAAMSGWGKEQLGSLGIGRQRDIEANASGAIGELATQQAGMGMEAASKLWGMQQDINAQENWEKQFGWNKETWEKTFNLGKDQWDKQFGFTQQQFDFAKKQYGDTEGQRIAADIQAGLSYEQIKAKYPQVTKEDYDRMATGFQQSMQKALDMDLASHFMNNYTTAGYDWKKDPEAIKKLEAAWKAAGFTKPFDMNDPECAKWAQQRFDTATQSPGQLLAGQLHSTPTYKNAPIGGTGPDGKKIYEITNPDGSKTYTKEFYDEKLIPYLQKMADFGTQISFKLDQNGNIIAIDNATGNPINTGTGDNTNVIGGPGNYINTDGTYKTADAVKDFNKIYSGTDVSETGMKQYLEKSKGKLPTEDEWNEWSLNERVYDFKDPSDLKNAYDMFDEEYMLEGVTENAMKQYLEKNGGKLPKNEKAWEDWSKKDRVYGTEGDDLTAAFTNVFNMGGNDSTIDRVKQYLEEHGGKLPTVDKWNEWNDSTGNEKYIKDFLNGEKKNLRDVDKKMLSEIRDAQEAVANGSATEEQKKLAAKAPTINTYKEGDSSSDETDGFYGSGMGKTHRKITYDSSLYDSSGNGHQIKFNDATKEKFNKMGGKTIFYNGKYYKVDANKPITEGYKFYSKKLISGNDSRTQDFYSDALNVVDLETGEPIQLTFGASGKYWD